MDTEDVLKSMMLMLNGQKSLSLTKFALPELQPWHKLAPHWNLCTVFPANPNTQTN